ncbi:hypothetical protein PPUN109347_12160 [Pseudomonas putida]|jgi:hypothetical protein|nr:hypothetical protein PPUN109347_12160 [Pseudomonas putida]
MLSLMPSNCAPIKGLPTVVVIAAGGKVMPLTGKHMPSVVPSEYPTALFSRC